MKTKSVYVVRFEHCSDSDENKLKKANSKRGAYVAASVIILNNLDRCEDEAAATIRSLCDKGMYEQAVEMFIEQQEAGGDCLLSIDKV